MKIRIRHRTTYYYAEPVQFGPHRLMLRPREGHDVKIEQSLLEISPAHTMHWIRDVNGNSIAVADFSERADQLVVFSDLVLNHFEINPFDFQIEPGAIHYPFSYDAETALELSPLIQPLYPADTAAVQGWLSPFFRPGETVETVELLQRLNGHISRTFRYQVREEAGVQTPSQTISLNSGSCRDFATLFMEACRRLGLAARFVSGYILSGGTSAGASTHAWTEVYIPGAGWKGFDPTLGILTTSQHVTIAVARHPENAMPISGSFNGSSNAFLRAEVSVFVENLGGT